MFLTFVYVLMEYTVTTKIVPTQQLKSKNLKYPLSTKFQQYLNIKHFFFLLIIFIQTISCLKC